MEININCEKNLTIDENKLKKMLFFFNAIEDGWKIKKKNNIYFFSKDHNNNKEMFLDSYLNKFIEENFNLPNIKINN